MAEGLPISTTTRLISIDAFRALIMILMIFVNDLWTLVGIPKWLEHVSAETDGMGLADIVFPAFLFIVGLSVPYAIQSRRKKGDPTLRIFLHVISRTIALLVMGLFLVNAETYSEHAMVPRNLWMLILIIAFFLIWLDYKDPNTAVVKSLKAIGVGLLIGLVCTYENDSGNGIRAMEISWWGILGLIGWAYFISSAVYLFSAGKVWILVAALLLFILFSSANYLGWLEPLASIKSYVWISGDGSMPALSMAGILTALAYKNLTSKNRAFWLYAFALALVLIVFGIITRPIWGISKINATPSWTTICSGISILCFLLIVFITDVRKLTNWYQPIKPAGTSTLTSYLLPYIHYAILGMIWIQLPVFFRTGAVGLLKSLVYAILIVLITGLMEKRNIRLKI
jgi:predicted acyltransferase